MFGMIPFERHDDNMFDMFDNFQKKFFNDSNAKLPAFRTDIRDQGDKFLLEAELPGFQKEEISLELKEGILTIRAEHKESEEKGEYVRRERRYGSFARTFDVSGIDESGITDNTDSMGSGFTPWEQISEVFLLRLKDDTYLCAVPTDYDSWASTRNRRQARLAQANKDMGFAPIRIQFKKANDKYTAQDGLAAVRRFAPEKISRIRKPKY